MSLIPLDLSLMEAELTVSVTLLLHQNRTHGYSSPDLDRSQPPLFIQMLDRYVQVTGDKSILTRALPLAEVLSLIRHQSSVLKFCIERTHLVAQKSFIDGQEPFHKRDSPCIPLQRQ